MVLAGQKISFHSIVSWRLFVGIISGFWRVLAYIFKVSTAIVIFILVFLIANIDSKCFLNV